ncbi:hypothetical protein NSK_004897 [Nannochloropsis salina CCMP1776]|uniref:Uncharacterized protein n=1 Tax=Nannochloropsis salina CCMP1776 TaxID=1027361 RepID=A0A4D9D2X3_9STRA|nr:hypothetical protein NSK_004897 [Nannochloropsis salina CCMP1776]|eukprot:TFJ83795.1 hypothetical protein NSK_004897 [Nannochloropsis salina CCMP1776]
MMMMMMMMVAAPGAGKNAATLSTRNRNRTTVVLVTLGITMAALLPYGIRKLRDGRSLYQSDKPLTGSQIMRGAYMNTSSQDIGPDPDYDFRSGEWHGRRNDPTKK